MELVSVDDPPADEVVGNLTFATVTAGWVRKRSIFSESGGKQGGKNGPENERNK